jgi:hypothetical protein
MKWEILNRDHLPRQICVFNVKQIHMISAEYLPTPGNICNKVRENTANTLYKTIPDSAKWERENAWCVCGKIQKLYGCTLL